MTYIHVDIDPELKIKAQKSLRDQGKTLSGAIRVFLEKQVDPYPEGNFSPQAEADMEQSIKDYEEGRYTTMTIAEFKEEIERQVFDELNKKYNKKGYESASNS